MDLSLNHSSIIQIKNNKKFIPYSKFVAKKFDPDQSSENNY